MPRARKLTIPTHEEIAEACKGKQEVRAVSARLVGNFLFLKLAISKTVSATVYLDPTKADDVRQILEAALPPFDASASATKWARSDLEMAFGIAP